MNMQPGMPGSGIITDASLGKELTNIWRAIQQLAAANPLKPAGITVQPNGITVTGSETITGTLQVDGTASFQGDTDIGGNARITGTLSLPAGIIDNDALANPVDVDTASAYSNTHGYVTTTTPVKTASFTVPPGFSRAMVTCNAVAQGKNSTASTDYLYVQAVVNGFTGGEIFTTAAAGASVAVTAPLYYTLTGLSGGSVINAAVSARSGLSAWAPSTANLAIIYAQVLFLR